eukprot:237492_1
MEDGQDDFFESMNEYNAAGKSRTSRGQNDDTTSQASFNSANVDNDLLTLQDRVNDFNQNKKKSKKQNINQSMYLMENPIDSKFEEYKKQETQNYTLLRCELEILIRNESEKKKK